MFRPTMPEGLRLSRTTPEFTDRTVPAGLLSSHRVAPGVWGRLRVRAGRVRFVFEHEGGPPTIHALDAGGQVDIPPDTPHHVEPEPGSRFVVEFHRP